MKRVFTVVCLACALSFVDAADKKAEAKSLSSADLNMTEINGKVAEATNVSSYTYILVDTGSKKVWAAAPKFEVKVGDSVKVADAMAMPNYQSKTLNRTFDVVYFTGSVMVNGKVPAGAEPMNAARAGGQLPAGHPPIGGSSGAQAQAGGLPAGHPAIGSAAQASKEIKVKKVDGGKTIAEIYSGHSKLNGKKVSVRGQVVKYNDAIMERNWIHIQDGTGKPGANDLLITSKKDVKVGDTIVATGTIASNKNFGSGYKYLVLMEDADIVKE